MRVHLILLIEIVDRAGSPQLPEKMPFDYIAELCEHLTLSADTERKALSNEHRNSVVVCHRLCLIPRKKALSDFSIRSGAVSCKTIDSGYLARTRALLLACPAATSTHYKGKPNREGSYMSSDWMRGLFSEAVTSEWRNHRRIFKQSVTSCLEAKFDSHVGSPNDSRQPYDRHSETLTALTK
jgi:hypothetical protein